MLQSLKSFSSDFSQKVLVVLGEKFITDPLGEKATYDIDPLIIESTLQEIKNRMHIRENELSEKSKSKILNFISDEITSVTLKPFQKQKAKERLGDKGLLALKDYKLVLTSITPTFQLLGVSPAHIKDAFQFHDKYYHVENPKTPVTFFSKLIKTDKSENNFIVFVLADRDGDLLVVRAAWRVYLSDVNISEDYNISQLLDIFLDRYGMLIKTPTTNWSKLIWFDLSRYNTNQDIEVWNQESLTDHRFLKIATRKRAPSFGLIEVFCIYAVDIEKYLADLIKHGAVGNDLLDKKKYPIGYFHFSTY
ncbi:hypothetical protein [Spirosoma aerolatum]|uniref:hypothetical protein n=1 Tax=Spirosoma aerolatum TaxID=1211326 RepID=UPI0009ABCB27|nr:hypothetical protein [Spirosoma aerolatum]